MIIKIPMGEWMITAGLVGLQRVFEFGLKEEYIDSSMRGHIKICHDGLEVNTEVLPFLPESYLWYMMNEFDVYKREMRKINDALKFVKSETGFAKAANKVKGIIEKNITKIKKIFPEVVPELEEIVARIEKLKNIEQREELEFYVKQFESFLKREDINEKLTSNYFRAEVLGMFFGQVSFLQYKKDGFSFEEMKDKFFDDYIRPVIQDLTLQEMLQNGTSKKEILNYIKETNKELRKKGSRNKGSRYGVVKELLKKKEPQEIMKCINSCLFFNDLLAFDNFEEKVFSPLMVAKDRALNFCWNLNKEQQPLPISSLAKLVLFFAPAGMAVYYKKEGFEKKKDNKNKNKNEEFNLYVGFVQMESSFRKIFATNNTFKILKENKDPFDRIVSKTVQGMQKEAEYSINNMYFLEFTSEYRTKKTRMYYYHLPNYLAQFFNEEGETEGKKLDWIQSYQFREQFVQYLLRGADPFPVILRYISHLVSEDSSNAYGCLAMVRIRHHINQLKKGVFRDMSRNTKKINAIFKCGEEIRRAYEKGYSSQKETNSSYVASAQKKVSSIVYRLLNLMKAGKRTKFFYEVNRLYLSTGKELPSLLLEVLTENEVDFETAAGAFIAGLQSFGKEKLDTKEEKAI